MRKADRRIYLYTGVLTIILYIMGIYTGLFMYSLGATQSAEEISGLRQEIQDYSRSLEGLQLQQLYLTSDSNMSCRFLVSSLSEYQGRLYGFRQNLPERLELYEKHNVQDADYVALKRDYMGLLLKAWMFSREVRSRCGSGIDTILYFYSAGCDECIEQGYVLDRVRDSSNAMVFTIDYGLEDPTAGIVKDAYGLRGTPSLVVNEVPLSGFQGYDRVMAALGER